MQDDEDVEQYATLHDFDSRLAGRVDVGRGRLANPGPNEIRIRHEAIGVNYIDVYHRTGSYPLELPSGIGVEGAGIVEAGGSRVSDFAPGDRVAYVGGPPGAYSTFA